MTTNLFFRWGVFPFFLLLLPVFFVLHGSAENYPFIPFKDALYLTGFYFLVSLVIFFIARFFFRDTTKAAVFSFLCMSFHFFFGSMQDLLKKNLSADSLFLKYSFLLSAAFLLFLFAVIALKKRKKPLRLLSSYLNIVLLLLLLIDTAMLAGKMFEQKSSPAFPAGYTKCNTCPRPDIYFILADEYAGNKELKEIFSFDNNFFSGELTTRGFRSLNNTSSNYNYTPFSVASILNMDYLDLAGKERSKPDLTYSYEKIKTNTLLRFLQQHDYTFYNYSIFNFNGQPARTNETFLPNKTKLITAQTFISRMEKDLGFNLITRLKSKSSIRKAVYRSYNNNKRIYDLTWQLADRKISNPKFVYTHLMMPHYPYYFDSAGKEQPFESLHEGQQGNKQHYIQYLQYANRQLLKLIDHILKSSSTPPVILLMGDHGFRHFTEPVEKQYYFLNHTSVLLPSKNYTGFNDSMTAVNVFRTVLNTAFNQQLPLLKDSTIYLKD